MRRHQFPTCKFSEPIHQQALHVAQSQWLCSTPPNYTNFAIKSQSFLFRHQIGNHFARYHFLWVLFVDLYVRFWLRFGNSVCRMNEYNIDSIDDDYWTDLIDCSSLLDHISPPLDVRWNPQLQSQNVCLTVDASRSGATSHECPEKECLGKRGQHCGGVDKKACRERKRREKLNEKFSQLAAALEPGRPVKTDKLAILGDAIKMLNQLNNESREYTEMNERLLEEIKNLKAEKNELREEKQTLKAEKERIEQQLKILNIPPIGFMPTPPPIYPAEINKVPMFPNYGFVPMWPYFPSTAGDTSQDHELWPPAA
ncbi:transcription factor bHLH115-like [Andrographis paniculata]|uniref:transcription factor bHLH115-like n=1 Tax=Andrographis paniculata TaxID=175694 RepID=UPI0021E8E280|nr:transcription factor bHLH115-like [Andrographis paniculata]